MSPCFIGDFNELIVCASELQVKNQVKDIINSTMNNKTEKGVVAMSDVIVNCEFEHILEHMTSVRLANELLQFSERVQVAAGS